MKRVLTILLLAVLLLASCGNEAPAEDTSATETKIVQTETDTETETTDIDLLPEADYEGVDFHILSTDPETLWGYMVSIYADEENGEPLNDAVFQRNISIEERYNITISNTAEKDNSATSVEAKNLALSGDNLYSIMCYSTKLQLADAMSGCFQNLHSIPSINLENNWWNTEAAELLTVQDRLYIAFSEMNVFDNESLPGIYVNFDLLEDNDLESPYNMVREGSWTLDNVYDMAAVVVQDMDGDGVASAPDVLGFIGGIGSYNDLLFSCNQPHVLIEAGKYVLNHGTEGSIAAAEKIAKLMNDPVVSACRDGMPPDWPKVAFDESRVLFFHSGLANLSRLREAEFYVGVVPMPKFDENQESYRAPCSNQSMTIAIPVSNTESERTGVICEALGAYSRLPLREVYFETLLKHKAARDEETAEMLDIIVNAKCIDVGTMNETAWGAVTTPYFKSIHTHGTEKLASTAASTKKAFDTAVAKLEDTYAGLE